MEISDIIYEAQSQPNISCLVVRRTWLELKELFNRYNHTANRVDKINSVYYFKNGSRIYFGVIGAHEDTSKYQGMEFQYLDTDQIEQDYASILELRKRIKYV